jgi:glutaredoxin 3
MTKHPKQADVVMYTKDYCPYCVAATNLLTQKGVVFEEIDVTRDTVRYEEMLHKAAPRRTVPQIFIGDQGVGGFDDVKRLDQDSKLEGLLFPQGR